MRTPREIYARYDIMPDLQLHQLRVAAVASLVCGSAGLPIDRHTAVLACLFHDMGNIVKFDLSVFPQFLEPQGFEYWSGVKERFERTYGIDQHAANAAIAREIGLPGEVIACIEIVAFSKAKNTLEHGTREQYVCEYADSRVGPHGILPLLDRLDEARVRYLKRGSRREDIALVTDAHFDELVAAEREIERRLFAGASLRPEDITDERAAPVIEKLWEYPVP